MQRSTSLDGRDAGCRSLTDGCLSSSGVVDGDVAVGDAAASAAVAAQLRLEEDVVVAAAAVPAVVAMVSAAAMCLDEGGDGKQSSRTETPGERCGCTA